MKKMQQGYPFNVRVYGILLDERKEAVLLSEEEVMGELIHKFPGGGLRFGEGPEDCVIREFQEELGIRVEIVAHFYTTGFFQASAFDPEEQVISIYYRVRGDAEPLPHRWSSDNGESFFWKSLQRIGPDSFQLGIDRVVGGMIRENFTPSS